MSRATLGDREVRAGGRLGRFVVRPSGPRWDFQPGQFTSVGLDTPHGFVVRAYSIANAPEQAGQAHRRLEAGGTRGRLVLVF